MDIIFDLIEFLLRDPSTLALAAVVAGGIGAAVLGGQWVMARADVKRRTRRLVTDGPSVALDANGHNAGGPDLAGVIANPKESIQRLTQSIDRMFGEGSDSTKKILRKKLVQAGYYAPSAPGNFIAIRLGGLIVLGAIGFSVALMLGDQMKDAYIKMVAAAGLGYVAPPFFLDRIIAGRTEQHRAGFPDFLDLMIVCCEAGLSMEAAINRVCQEMAGSYPSLSANLYFTTLEIRAGRSVNEALLNMSDRLGIEEARTFATLLQQSAELGSSLVDSLKIYSEEMRNKRMMKAEEKANSLPTKMMIPMMIFIFPIIFIILLFPAYLRVLENWQ